MDGLMETAPRRWGPNPGMQEKSGAASSARFTFAEEPRKRNARTPRISSSGSSFSSTRSRKVRRGSRLEDTTFACSSSPLARATPVTRPFLTSTCATGASVRISAPASRAAEAIASATAPVPPLAKPHARKWPSISPM